MVSALPGGKNNPPPPPRHLFSAVCEGLISPPPPPLNQSLFFLVLRCRFPTPYDLSSRPRSCLSFLRVFLCCLAFFRRCRKVLPRVCPKSSSVFPLPRAFPFLFGHSESPFPTLITQPRGATPSPLFTGWQKCSYPHFLCLKAPSLKWKTRFILHALRAKFVPGLVHRISFPIPFPFSLGRVTVAPARQAMPAQSPSSLRTALHAPLFNPDGSSRLPSRLFGFPQFLLPRNPTLLFHISLSPCHLGSAPRCVPIRSLILKSRQIYFPGSFLHRPNH